MLRLQALFLVMALLAAVPGSAAPSCRASSDRLKRPLVELYTSEGCDSCPPADRWFSSRFDAKAANASAIALAFHVDYWDRLGWVDRFATPAYTERQQDAMRANGASFVYTPQILLQGHDFAGWRNDATASLASVSRAPARATITLEAAAGDHDVRINADVQLAEASLARDARVFVAFADSGLVSNVKAGENRGVRLTHDHVVRAFRLAGTPTSDGHLRTTLTLPRPAEAGTHPMVVAFVQRASTGDVLQALALPLDACVAP